MANYQSGLGQLELIVPIATTLVNAGLQYVTAEQQQQAANKRAEDANNAAIVAKQLADAQIADIQSSQNKTKTITYVAIGAAALISLIALTR